MTRVEARKDSALEHTWDNLTELTAAAAIRDGSLTAQDYAAALLLHSRKQADLRAFITLDADAVLEAAAKADQHQKSGKSMGPLHGVPIGIKDSMCTSDVPTSIGTQVLAGFRPGKDAAVVAAVRAAGAILFGKNNLVEMSYGLTGVNEHHGQARNPYDKGRITGGSSSGAGASVGGRLIPAALGGDTVGSSARTIVARSRDEVSGSLRVSCPPPASPHPWARPDDDLPQSLSASPGATSSIEPPRRPDQRAI